MDNNNMDNNNMDNMDKNNNKSNILSTTDPILTKLLWKVSGIKRQQKQNRSNNNNKYISATVGEL